MLASLELRTPYLQRELAEFAISVSPSIHLARRRQAAAAAPSRPAAAGRAPAPQGRLPAARRRLAAGSAGAADGGPDRPRLRSTRRDGSARDAASRLLAEHRSRPRRPQPRALAAARRGPLAGPLPRPGRGLMRTLVLTPDFPPAPGGSSCSCTASSPRAEPRAAGSSPSTSPGPTEFDRDGEHRRPAACGCRRFPRPASMLALNAGGAGGGERVPARRRCSARTS